MSSGCGNDGPFCTRWSVSRRNVWRCAKTAVSSLSDPCLKWKTSRLVTRDARAFWNRSPSARSVPSRARSVRKPCTSPSTWRTVTGSAIEAWAATSSSEELSSVARSDLMRSIFIAPKMPARSRPTLPPRFAVSQLRGDGGGDFVRGVRVGMAIPREPPVGIEPDAHVRDLLVHDSAPQQALRVVFGSEVRDHDERLGHACARELDRRAQDRARSPDADLH